MKTELTEEQVVRVLANRDGKGQHDWSKGLGSDDNPQIGFIAQCNVCMINADEAGANELCLLAEVPPYLTSRDALAPILAGLSVGEKQALLHKLVFELQDENASTHSLLYWRLITLPARDLAFAIAAVLQNK